jgi:hypothetical protein
MIKDCNVCFEDSYLSKVLRCKHHFCMKCITEWATITSSCPMCRNEIKITFDIKIYRLIHANSKKLNKNLILGK